MHQRKARIWKTSQREIVCSDRTLVMAILNITPDSFSDGGKHYTLERALAKAEKLLEDGADILDIGGESTRPSSRRVPVEDEIRRVVPVIEAVRKRFDVPVSVDTTKGAVAARACAAGAEILNDISGLNFDETVGQIAAEYKTGLVLMHLRGEFETMHRQKPVTDILTEVSEGLKQSIDIAERSGVETERICLDVGIGFSKTFEQNLELIAKLDKLCREFENFPLLVGTSRKSFIGKILDDAPADERINGTLASNVVAAWNGANIVRVHDVRETVEALKVVDALRKEL
jgi:dihydropteroate synthase